MGSNSNNNMSSNFSNDNSSSSNNHDDQKLYDDWKGFLVSDRPDVRVAATQAVLEVDDATRKILVQQHGFVALLAQNTAYDRDEAVAVNALKALVYLSSSSSSHGGCGGDATGINQCVLDLHESGGVNRMLEIALSSSSKSNDNKMWRQKVNYALALLANLTRTEEGAVELVGRTLPDEAVPSSSTHRLEETTTGQQQEEVGGGGASSIISSTVPLLPTKPTLELLLARFLSTDYCSDPPSSSKNSSSHEEQPQEEDYYEQLLRL